MTLTREALFDAIHALLSERFELPSLDAYALDARLNEDLYLDSVHLLRVFLHLELEHQMAMPEEAIAKQELETVDDLISLYIPKTVQPTYALTGGEVDEGVHGEAYYDIKVHCFVSCVSAGLKAQGIDHRPLYFMLWDAKFDVNERFKLLYHSHNIQQDHYSYWFTRLYHVPVEEWYDHSISQEANLAVLLRLLDERRADQSLMVLLDMYHLPERENKFNQNPFPHYLMLEKSDVPDHWMVRDPDYRWEGLIDIATVKNAILQPSAGGGYRFDQSLAKPARFEEVKALFEASLLEQSNPIIDALREIVRAHELGSNGLGLAHLSEAVKELPVLTIRKYAYEHGFAYFWRALDLPSDDFETWCEEIETLIQHLKSIHYLVLKLASTKEATDLADLYIRIDEADAQEFKLKAKLREIFDQWVVRGAHLIAAE
jgi:acyl carrier protein